MLIWLKRRPGSQTFKPLLFCQGKNLLKLKKKQQQQQHMCLLAAGAACSLMFLITDFRREISQNKLVFVTMAIYIPLTFWLKFTF